MKLLIILAAIITAAIAGFFALDYLGYNPIREYRIAAELDRMPARSISVECSDERCHVEAENRVRGYQFSFSDFAELKKKVAKVRAIDKKWPKSKRECLQTRQEDQLAWCEV